MCLNLSINCFLFFICTPLCQNLATALTVSLTQLLTVWSDIGVCYSKSSRSRNKLLASNRGGGEVCEEDKMCVKSERRDFTTHLLQMCGDINMVV